MEDSFCQRVFRVSFYLCLFPAEARDEGVDDAHRDGGGGGGVDEAHRDGGGGGGGVDEEQGGEVGGGGGREVGEFRYSQFG